MALAYKWKCGEIRSASRKSCGTSTFSLLFLHVMDEFSCKMGYVNLALSGVLCFLDTGTGNDEAIYLKVCLWKV